MLSLESKNIFSFYFLKFEKYFLLNFEGFLKGEPTNIFRVGQDFASTIGVSIVMAWHEYRSGTAEQRTELLELWDIDGSASHRDAVGTLIEGALGAILVHDMSNKKSYENIANWLTLLDGKPRSSATSRSLQADLESCHIPLLTVGCKLDLAMHRAPSGYDKINLDCRKPIPAGSTASMALAKFFDLTIDRTRAPQAERRRRLNDSSPFQTSPSKSVNPFNSPLLG
ncbi:hypothetical protein WR25_01672 isoform D [Diploscapter pachys]|uniref:Uncharacterized protein n=1 Tax=Diploscapter pachys TaxID=2018661 RepID=A0A2A2JSD2_9BILA|nr:hypothetical protein WR25_01672 isoform A [Diploscapter pachys]PAV64582.1 hypothetical protein WR25_01672 isoform B [Diploscapter pachys]PAV64583.1 hypothetical protein WR25_01672 isoform C [Diploscapter pachys]PAV64584.1 hypothetical protein WR25_01672 isoform D [Diploscapter pachys]